MKINRGPIKSKRRAQADIDRNWNARYTAFINAGFDNSESTWAADHGAALKEKRTKVLLSRRRQIIDFYMREMALTRAKAVKLAAKDLREKLKRLDITDFNVYYDLSP